MEISKRIGTLRIVNKQNKFRRYEAVYPKIPFKTLSIANTINTTVTCRVCRGTGQIINFGGSFTAIENTCPECNGTKKMVAI